jgi:hypothetical protein
MEPGEIHNTQVRGMASLLTRGMSLEEAVNEILEDTKAAAARAGKEKEWDWAKEKHDICRQGADWINKHPELLTRLPDRIREILRFKSMGYLVEGQAPSSWRPSSLLWRS